MKRGFVRFWLYNKRLLKKPGYMAILLLIMLLAASLRLVSENDTGLVTVTLYARDESDELSGKIIKSLLSEGGLVRYELAQSKNEAIEAVESMNSDAAWIFPEALEKEISRASAERYLSPIVEVVEREQSVKLLITHEILCHELYAVLSKEISYSYIDGSLGLSLPREKYDALYEEYRFKGELISIVTPDGDKKPENESNFLLTPVRGLMSLWLMLCVFAGILYFIKDMKEGVLGTVPLKKRINVCIQMESALLLQTGIIFLTALIWAGVTTSLWREIVCLSVFLICSMFFGIAVFILLRTQERFGFAMLILILLMFCLSPIFFTVRRLRTVSYILPPSLYLRAVYSDRFLLYMLGYTFILGGIIFIAKNREIIYNT